MDSNVIDIKTRQPISDLTMEARILAGLREESHVKMFWELFMPRVAGLMASEICQSIGSNSEADFIIYEREAEQMLKDEYYHAMYPERGGYA